MARYRGGKIQASVCSTGSKRTFAYLIVPDPSLTEQKELINSVWFASLPVLCSPQLSGCVQNILKLGGSSLAQKLSL